MLVDVPCVGITDPINEVVMDQIADCVGLVYVINCTQDNDFEVNKVSILICFPHIFKGKDMMFGYGYG